MSREEIKTKRGQAIYDFCEGLHNNIDDLYEMMMDGDDDDEKKLVDNIIQKLNELNIDKE